MRKLEFSLCLKLSAQWEVIKTCFNAGERSFYWFKNITANAPNKDDNVKKPNNKFAHFTSHSLSLITAFFIIIGFSPFLSNIFL